MNAVTDDTPSLTAVYGHITTTVTAIGDVMGLDLTTYKVTLRLAEDMLGTVPKNKNVYSSYLAGKAKDAIAKDAKKGIPLASGEHPADPNDLSDVTKGRVDVEAMIAGETESIRDVEERGWTGFHEEANGVSPEDAKPFIFDYMIRGYACEAARTIREIGKVKQLSDKFKRFVAVKPRKIFFKAEDGSFITKRHCSVNERPLRGQTPQGPRVTVVRSDVIPAGTHLEFNLVVLKGGGITKPIIETVLSYGGTFMGLGQWRSGGWGRFDVIEIEKVSGGADDDENDDD